MIRRLFLASIVGSSREEIGSDKPSMVELGKSVGEGIDARSNNKVVPLIDWLWSKPIVVACSNGSKGRKWVGETLGEQFHFICGMTIGPFRRGCYFGTNDGMRTRMVERSSLWKRSYHLFGRVEMMRNMLV